MDEGADITLIYFDFLTKPFRFLMSDPNKKSLLKILMFKKDSWQYSVNCSLTMRKAKLSTM